MESILTKLLEKVSHYEIVNNLIPGAALCFILSYIGYPILDHDFGKCVIVCYLMGVVNSRFSSLFVEWLFRKSHFIEWRNYDLYCRAKKEKPFVGTLLEIANMYRAFVSVFIISLAAYGLMLLSGKWLWLSQNSTWVLLVLALVLFAFSYRKQTNEYVVKNIDEVSQTGKDIKKE